MQLLARKEATPMFHFWAMLLTRFVCSLVLGHQVELAHNWMTEMGKDSLRISSLFYVVIPLTCPEGASNSANILPCKNCRQRCLLDEFFRIYGTIYRYPCNYSYHNLLRPMFLFESVRQPYLERLSVVRNLCPSISTLGRKQDGTRHRKNLDFHVSTSTLTTAHSPIFEKKLRNLTSFFVSKSKDPAAAIQPHQHYQPLASQSIRN